jgi:3-phenylpropionate/cinnamic acid dioxygenase small subunit
MDSARFLKERFEIEDLIARYAHAADGYDADGWLRCYTDDGVFEVEMGSNRIRFSGALALQDFILAHIRLLPGTRHVQTNHLVDIEEVSAKHRCTLAGMLSRPEKVYTFISGWYESTLEKTSVGWRIKRRIVHVDNGANFTQGELAVHIKPFMEWMAENGAVV